MSYTYAGSYDERNDLSGMEEKPGELVTCMGQCRQHHLPQLRQTCRVGLKRLRNSFAKFV